MLSLSVKSVRRENLPSETAKFVAKAWAEIALNQPASTAKMSTTHTACLKMLHPARDASIGEFRWDWEQKVRK